MVAVDRPIRAGARSRELLKLLWEAGGAVLSSSQIARELYGDDGRDEIRAVHALVWRTRKQGFADRIQTIFIERGVSGYRWHEGRQQQQGA